MATRLHLELKAAGDSGAPAKFRSAALAVADHRPRSQGQSPPLASRTGHAFRGGDTLGRVNLVRDATEGPCIVSSRQLDEEGSLNVARRTETVVHLTDDLDGSTASETVSFAYQGTTYEIDLSKANVKAFDKTMGRYVSSARKMRNARRPGASRASGKHNVADIREWAANNGYEVSSRGRISAAIIEAYDAAH